MAQSNMKTFVVELYGDDGKIIEERYEARKAFTDGGTLILWGLGDFVVQCFNSSVWSRFWQVEE